MRKTRVVETWVDETAALTNPINVIVIGRWMRQEGERWGG